MTALHEEPATVEQLVAAMTALGFYTGSDDSAEHAAEALRLGGPDAYRMSLVNALLGAVQTEALLAEAIDMDGERRAGAHRQQLVTAEGLQWLLAMVAGGQQPAATDVDALVRNLEAARSSLLDAVANLDVLRRMLALADDLVRER